MSETTQLPQETLQASAPIKESLLDSLDDLLKRYLELLDQYQQAREQLSSQLADGYISIAQANFNAPNRARYGQDFYDERMQALRTVSVDESASVLKRTIVSTADKVGGSRLGEKQDASASEHTSTNKPGKESDKPADIDQKDKPASKTDLPYGATHTQEESEKPNGDAAENSDKSSESAEKHVDPIKWFGILVPPALRAAQKHFVGVVEKSVPAVVNLSDELRSLEIEIGRTRKKIRKLDN